MSSERRIEVDLDGYTDLPPGTLASVVTYLDMSAPPPARPEARRPDLTLVHARAPDLASYRSLYAGIGEDLLWFSRRRMDDAALAAVLAAPGTAIHELHRNGTPVGLIEFNDDDDGGIELAYFGVVPSEVGTGAGRWLMNRAIALAFQRPITRFWLHTCNYDHPDALAFYRRSGFKPYKTALELGPDPRLDGTLPRTAAPQVPLIDPPEAMSLTP